MKIFEIKFREIVAITLLFCAIFVIIPQIISYALTPEENIQNSGVIPDECKQVLIYGDKTRGIKGFEPELKDFLTFLDANFKNKSSTSSLVPLAIARYKEYRDSLRAQFQKIQVAGVKKAAADTKGLTDIPTFQQQTQSYALCQEIVDTYISLGREQMMKHIKTAAAQKKAIMLLEKYKAVNARLRALNMKVAEMFSLYKTFKGKFSCYSAKSCMKSL